MSPGTDPRINPKLRSILVASGLDGVAAAPPVSRRGSATSVADFIVAMEAGFGALFEPCPTTCQAMIDPR